MTDKKPLPHDSGFFIPGKLPSCPGLSFSFAPILALPRHLSIAAGPRCCYVKSFMDTPAFVNISSCLTEMAGRQPHSLAIIFPEGRDRSGRVSYTHYTFNQLDRESDLLARGLEQAGVTRGTRTALMVTPSLEFFALTFALFKAGAVPVLIDPGIGARNIGNCLLDAQPEAFIGIPKAHVARVLLGWGKRTIRINITVGNRFGWGGTTLAKVRSRAGRGVFLCRNRAERDCRDSLHQWQHRPPQGGGLYPREFRRPGRPAAKPVRHSAR